VALLIVRHLRSVAPRLEGLPSVTSDMCADSVNLCGVFWTLAIRAIVMVSNNPKMCKQGTTGKRKHVTLII